MHPTSEIWEGSTKSIHSINPLINPVRHGDSIKIDNGTMLVVENRMNGWTIFDHKGKFISCSGHCQTSLIRDLINLNEQSLIGV